MTLHPQGHHHVKVTLNHPKHPKHPLVDFITIPPLLRAPNDTTPAALVTSISSPSHVSSHLPRTSTRYPTFAVFLPVNVRCRPTPALESEVHVHPRSMKLNSNRHQPKKVQSLSPGPAMSTLHCSTWNWSPLTLHRPLLVNINTCDYSIVYLEKCYSGNASSLSRLLSLTLQWSVL